MNDLIILWLAAIFFSWLLLMIGYVVLHLLEGWKELHREAIIEMHKNQLARRWNDME